MELKVNNNNGNIIILPVGRLDSATAGDFEIKALPLVTEDVTSFTVDMSEVDFISSKGLRVLVSIYKKLNGKELSLVGVNNSVKEILKLSGFCKIFNIAD